MIQVLSNEVIDQIAAGEVVERPAHLIKELVENSLDAGATKIDVEVSAGGKFVRITDNGCGMSPEDLKLCVARHATSKISQFQDIWNLNTFGFRGEALASIAAVSKTIITSKQRDANDSEHAHQLTLEFGTIKSLDQVSHAKGTTIVIDGLFSNTPARLKFLKSESAETTQIKSVIKAIALANPQTEFRMTQNNELVYLWTIAEDRLQRAKQVLEIENLYFGSATRGQVRAYSIFADPNTTAKTSKNIWMFAQNRWVQDRSIQAAVIEAYRSLLMHGEYPIAVTWVETDPSEIDVNIHPTKSQVKFLDQQSVFRAVQASVRDVLEQAPWVRHVLEKTTQSLEGSGVERTTEAHLQSLVRQIEPAAQNYTFQDQALNSVQYQKKSFVYSAPQSSYQVEQTNSSHFESTTFGNNLKEHVEVLSQESKSPRAYWSNLEILGQAGLTYIVCQNQHSIVFVDQHAAHERVVFESLMSAVRGGQLEVQDFLFPIQIELSAEKVEAILTHRETLQKLGIQVEQMSPTHIGVNSAPTLVKESVLSVQLEKLAQEILDKGDSFLMDKIIGDICATLACHSVVRAGQALSLEQMKSLLEQMDEFALSSFCPHGRPVYVEYPFAKLEKDFGRTL